MNSTLVNRNKDIHIPDSEKLNIDLPKDDLQNMKEIYNEEVLINKSWEPKIGEKYWYVLNANGSKLYDDLEGISIQQTSFTTYDDFETHQDRIFHGNCFKTIEGANNYIRTCGREKLKALLGITSKECMTFQEAKDTLNLTEDMVESLSDNIAALSYSIHNLFNYSKTNSYVEGFEQCMYIFTQELREYCYNDNKFKAALRKAEATIREYKKQNGYNESKHYIEK